MLVGRVPPHADPVRKQMVFQPQRNFQSVVLPNSPGPLALDQLVSPFCSKSELLEWASEVEAGKDGYVLGHSEAQGPSWSLP
jgi:hypothetical protein